MDGARTRQLHRFYQPNRVSTAQKAPFRNRSQRQGVHGPTRGLRATETTRMTTAADISGEDGCSKREIPHADQPRGRAGHQQPPECTALVTQPNGTNPTQACILARVCSRFKPAVFTLASPRPRQSGRRQDRLVEPRRGRCLHQHHGGVVIVIRNLRA